MRLNLESCKSNFGLVLLILFF
uniref:Uncharacterized protein n=1 Tax=Rhizophora mucronata TaxID=61149 RepID=A0A2P2JTY5_RHIMU